MDLQQRPPRLQRPLEPPAQVGLDRTPSSASRAPPAAASAASQCSSAWRCLPAALAARAAAGGSRRIAPASPARRAWWASRAGSAPPCASSARSTSPPARAGAAGDLVLDRPAREVVPEDDGVALQRGSRRDAGVDGRRTRADGLRQQPQLGRTRHHGGDLGDGARLRAERGDAQRPPRRGRSSGHRVRRGREHLGDEEGVAARHRVQVARRRAGPPGQRATAASDSGAGSIRRTTSRRERRRAPAGPRPSASASVRQVITRQPRERAEAAAEEREQVERRVVGPVHVLDDEDRRARGELVEDGGQQRLARAAGSSAASSAPPASRATSRSGPSGRGVTSGSHAPQSTRRAPRLARPRPTSAVLPIPASPATTTTRPAARECSSAASSAARSSSRSRSCTSAHVIAGIVRTDPRSLTHPPRAATRERRRSRPVRTARHAPRDARRRHEPARALRRRAVPAERGVVDPLRRRRPAAGALARWLGLAAAAAADRDVLARAVGPVLDVGCGPGRHLEELAARGVDAMGIDASPAAVALARRSGARVVHASIWDPGPLDGRAFSTVLLLDGNLGLGGRPLALLRRCAALLADDGRVLRRGDAAASRRPGAARGPARAQPPVPVELRRPRCAARARGPGRAAGRRDVARRGPAVRPAGAARRGVTTPAVRLRHHGSEVNERARRDVLVVDDEPTITEVVSRYLRARRLRDAHGRRRPRGARAAAARRPDLVVLDIMLPHLDGLGVLRRLQRGRGAPARGHPADRPQRRARPHRRACALGADDYVVKPFSPAELVARVDAVLRRTDADRPRRGADRASATSRSTRPRGASAVAGAEVALTQREFDLLAHPRRATRAACSRASSSWTRVWRFPFYTDTSTVTVHMRRLRTKIEADPAAPRWLQTVWGVGYRFEP